MLTHNDITAEPVTIRLSRFRTIEISLMTAAEYAPNIKIQLETYHTDTNKMKQFTFYIPLHCLSEFVSAMCNFETIAVERGLINEPVDVDAADGSARI